MSQNPVIPNCDVLFVASPSNFMEPSEAAYASDKLGPYIEGAQLNNVQFTTMLLPGTGSLGKSLPYRVYPFPRIPASLVFTATMKWVKSTYPGRQWSKPRYTDHLRGHVPKWNQVLTSVRPKLIVGIGLRQDLLQAAKESNIATVEVQHGLATGESMREVYWPDLVPDFFFVWDKHTADMAEKVGIKAIVTGHPYLSTNGLEFERNSHSQRAAAIAVTYEAKDSSDPFGCIPREVFDTAKQLLQEGYKLKFRLHPAFAGEKFFTSVLLRLWIWLHFPNSQIINPKRFTVRDVAMQTDFLLTRDSSLAFEFNLFGRKAVVTSGEARVRFRNHLGESFDAKSLIPDFGRLPPTYESPVDLLASFNRSFIGVEHLLNLVGEIKDKHQT